VETARAAIVSQTVSEAHTVSELVSSVAHLEARIEELQRGIQMGNGAGGYVADGVGCAGGVQAGVASSPPGGTN
jgi:hypothetical protein